MTPLELFSKIFFNFSHGFGDLTMFPGKVENFLKEKRHGKIQQYYSGLFGGDISLIFTVAAFELLVS